MLGKINAGRESLVACALLIVVACGSDEGTEAMPVAAQGTSGAGTSAGGESAPDTRTRDSLPERGNGAGGVFGTRNERASGGASTAPNDATSGNARAAAGADAESETFAFDPDWTPEDLAPTAWFFADPNDFLLESGVKHWRDHRGPSGPTLTQDFQPGRPQLDTVGWNGSQPTVRFSGGNLLNLASWSGSPTGTNAPFAVLAVMRSAVAQNAGIAAWWSEWGDGVWANIRSTSGLTLLDYWKLDDAITTQMYAGNQDLGTGRHVVAWRFSPSTQTVRLSVDGAHAVSSPQPPVGAIGAMPLIIGAMSPLPTGLFQGDISELVFVPSDVSDAQIQNFTEYARNAWSGLPATAGGGPCIKADGQLSPDDIRCDDGNPETFGDHCSVGTCVGVVPGPGSPKDLSPAAWYHAGAPEVVVTFGGVSTWYDRSSERRDLLNGYVGRPTLVTDGWNGNKPTVRFAGANAVKRQGWTGPPGGTESAFSVLAVLKPATSQSSGVVSWWNPNAYGRAICQIKASGGANALDLFRFDDATASQEAVGNIDLGSARHAVAWRYENGTVKLTVDGFTQTQQRSPIGAIPPDWFLMGVANGIPTGLFNGDISELAVIPTSISDDRVARFNEYAQAEWGGLTLCAPSCVGKAFGADNGCGGTCDGPGGSGSPCTGDAGCATGLACLDGWGPRFGKPRGTSVCGEEICLTHTFEVGCGFLGARCGSSCDDGIVCTQDSDCPGGEVCAIGKGSAYGLPFANVCVPPVCVSDPVSGGCGTVASLCGKCPCTPSCSNAECGGNASNGCDGRCREFCTDREPGCTGDSDCAAGSACFFGGGPRIGLAAGVNVCLPARCLDPNPARTPCGSVSSECGLCPEEPVGDACANLHCSSDPAVMSRCGLSACGASSTCVAGECVADFSVASLGLTTRSLPAQQDYIVGPEGRTPPFNETVPGALDGSFAVNSRGRATYSVPLTVPPARAGMEPDISLSYRGGSGNGPVGIGWSIGGLSSISRCPKIAALNQVSDDGWAEPIDFLDDDQLCLDGSPLVRVNQLPNLTPGAEYRTEIDSFSKVVIDVKNNRAFFKVFKKDGRIFSYGGVSNAELHRDRENHLVRAWALARIENRTGDFIEFKYGKFVDSGRNEDDPDQTVEFWPDEIGYGIVDQDGSPLPTRSVKFLYVDGRPDYTEGFTRNGSRIVRSKLLTRVETRVGSRVVRSYELGYENAPTGVPGLDPATHGVSRLKQIRECSFKDIVRECKRPTIFSYAGQQGLSDGNGDGRADVIDTGIVLPSSQLHTLDWNGDGLDDLLVGGPAKLLVATGNRTNPYRVIQTDVQCPDVLDHNHDGRDDALDTCDGTLWESTGDDEDGNPAFVVEPHGAGGYQEIRQYLADVNGDGTKDLFACFRGEGFVPGTAQLLLGDYRGGFESVPRAQVESWGRCAGEQSTAQDGILVIDVDGDGDEDILMGRDGDTSGNSWARFVPTPDGSAHWQRVGLPLELNRTVYNGAVRIVDVNGDGLKDIYAWLDTPTIFTNLGGYFDKGHPAYAGFWDFDGTRADDQSIALDYNGDGFEDLLRPFTPTNGAPPFWALEIGSVRDPQTSSITGPRAGLPWLRPDPAVLGAGPGYQTPRLDVLPVKGRFTGAGGRRPSLARADTSTLVDVDGDGSLDIAMIAASAGNANPRLQVVYGQFGREHLLTSIVDGMGKQIDVAYGTTQSFSDGSYRVHVPATPNCVNIDNRASGFSTCARRVGPLVSRYIIRYALGGPSAGTRLDRSFIMRYEGGREGLLGRGWLGFDRRIIEERTQLGDEEDIVLVQRTEISQDNRTFNEGGKYYPFAGLESIHVTQTPFAGSAIASGATQRVTRRTNSWIVKTSSKGRPFPCLGTSQERTSESTGAVSHLVSLTQNFKDCDSFGNVTSDLTLVHRPDEALLSRRIIQTRFDIRDGDEWLISLRDKVAEADLVPGASPEESIRTTEYRYDDRGLLESATREPEPNNDPASEPIPAETVGQKTTYERDPDAFFQVTSATTSGSWRDSDDETVSGTRKTSIEYDAEAIFPERMHEHRSAGIDCSSENAHTTDCLTTDVRFHPFDGTLITRVDPAGIVERMVFDAFGRNTYHITAADTIFTDYQDASPSDAEQIDVFPKLQIVTMSTKTGATSIRRVDALGRTVQTQSTGLGGESVLQEQEYLFGNLVDRVSRPHAPGDGSQGIVTKLYDARFRLTHELSTDGRLVQYQYAAAGFLNLGQGFEAAEAAATAMVDPNGRRSVSFLDARGLSVRMLDALGTPTRYAYGPFGILATVTETIEGEADHVTSIESDVLGRMTLHRDEDTGTRRNAYTAFDQVAFQTDNIDRITDLRYDAFGRLEHTEGSDAPTDFVYDVGENALGRLVATQTFDSNDNEIREELTYEAPTQNPLENRGFLQRIDRRLDGEEDSFTTSLHYNDKSQLEHVTLPTPDGTDPFEVHYGYDSFGSLTCVSDRPVPTPADCTGTYFWKLEEQFQGQRVKKESFGNGVTTTYGYDNLSGRLASLRTDHGTTAYQQITYPEYDDNGNLKERRQRFRNPAGGALTEVVETFDYDELNRLTGIVPSGGEAQSIQYKAHGNIQVKGGVGVYNYAKNSDELLRGPHAVRRIVNSDDETRFRYDGVGNVRERSGLGVVGGKQTYTYTSFNLPKTATIDPDGEAKTIRYEYDAAERRVVLSIDTNGDPADFASGEERRLYVGDEYERVRSREDTVVTTKHLYKVSAAGRHVAQVERAEQNGVFLEDQRRYIHDDHQGSSQVITNEDGALVHVQRFDPFGAPVPDTSTAESTDLATKGIRAGFTGHETDVETGLVNMRGRIYDPRIGRFMQADPLLQLGWSQTLNRYSYVANNPLNAVDPSGFDPEDAWDYGDYEEDSIATWTEPGGPTGPSPADVAKAANSDHGGPLGSPFGEGSEGGGCIACGINPDIGVLVASFAQASDGAPASGGSGKRVDKPSWIEEAAQKTGDAIVKAANLVGELVSGIFSSSSSSKASPAPPPQAAPKQAQQKSGGEPQATKTANVDFHVPPAESSDGEGAQAMPTGLQYVMANVPSIHSQLGQQSITTSIVHGTTAVFGTVAIGGAIGAGAGAAAGGSGAIVLWSGGELAQGGATAYALSTGAKTLEMTFTGKFLALMTTAKTYPYLRPLWVMASASFVKGAQGPVNVFLTSAGSVNMNSIWAQTEFPILLYQGNQIIYHSVGF